MRRLGLVLAIGSALAAPAAIGCAGRSGEIVTDPGDLSEGTGAPRIASVTELGGGDIVLTADLPAPEAGDGTATIGEALWVHGSNFGRRPTVEVAGRPGMVLARTADGGLVTRVPAGAPVGRQSLAVSTEGGKGTFPITVRRLAATVSPGGGRLTVLELSPDGPRAAGSVAASGTLLQVAADGRAAYVLDATTGRLTVFELPAQDGPRAVATIDLKGRETGAGVVLAFAAAAHAPALLAVRAGELFVLDTTAALRPVRGRPRPLPVEVAKAGVSRAALAPDGRSVALVTDDNRLMVLDVSRPTSPIALGPGGTLEIAPGARVPIVADVTFAPDGRTIWLALGDTTKSRVVGSQPTEIVAVRVGAGAAPLTVTRRVTIDEAEGPVHLTAGRARPLQSGASIRLPPERATVYLTALRKGGVAAVYRLGAEDQASAVVEAPASVDLGGAEPSPEGGWVLAPTADGSGRLGLIATPADGQPGARVVLDLGRGAPRAPGAQREAGLELPSLAAQP